MSWIAWNKVARICGVTCGEFADAMNSEDLPDAWPPTKEDLLGSSVVPLFPLPGIVLFPRQLMPLNIFEPRYRQMIEDSLDGPGRIVIASIPRHHELNDRGDPDVLPIAGLGEITQHRKLKDGRYLIWLFGLTRVRLCEVESERLYRKVKFEALPDEAMRGEYGERLMAAVVRAIRERADAEFKFPKGVTLGTLVDVLVQQLEVPTSEFEELFSELDTGRRAEMALRAHAKKK
ncbi:MAG: Lon protease-like protein [Planctomycetota bacterium]